jgi:hypothetical protein
MVVFCSTYLGRRGGSRKTISLRWFQTPKCCEVAVQHSVKACLAVKDLEAVRAIRNGAADGAPIKRGDINTVAAQQIRQSKGAVGAAADGLAAVGADHHRRDLVVMPGEGLAQLLTGGQVPAPQGVVGAGGAALPTRGPRPRPRDCRSTVRTGRGEGDIHRRNHAGEAKRTVNA